LVQYRQQEITPSCFFNNGREIGLIYYIGGKWFVLAVLKAGVCGGGDGGFLW